MTSVVRIFPVVAQLAVIFRNDAAARGNQPPIDVDVVEHGEPHSGRVARRGRIGASSKMMSMLRTAVAPNRNGGFDVSCGKTSALPNRAGRAAPVPSFRQNLGSQLLLRPNVCFGPSRKRRPLMST